MTGLRMNAEQSETLDKLAAVAKTSRQGVLLALLDLYGDAYRSYLDEQAALQARHLAKLRPAAKSAKPAKAKRG